VEVSAIQRTAIEAAEEAHLLFDAKHYAGACSRAYYAMFNMARTLLMLRGKKLEEVKTHKSVLALFSREYVQDGTFTAEMGRTLRQSANIRRAADYEGGVSREQAVQVVAVLDQFMDKAQAVLSTTRGG
jgi:uncharacterized protein (UPF0332 family)